MNKFQTFQEFVATQSIEIPVQSFIMNLLLAGILAFILAKVYVKYGNSLSNRRLFSRNFLLLSMITMLIISIVKSSLALSLGLVGALSIVRFRAAIKEPEELTFIFLSIAIGLGLGANQALITVVSFVIIVIIIMLRGIKVREIDNKKNLHLTVFSHNPNKTPINQIVDTLKGYSTRINLKRIDETKEALEVSFFIEFKNFEQLSEAKTELYKINDSMKITFLDREGII